MAWANAVLSTPNSIARIDAEVNILAGGTVHQCYKGDGASSIDFPDEVARIEWYDPDGNVTSVDLSVTWIVPEDTYVFRIVGYGIDDTRISEYNCDEGVELVALDVSGNGYHAELDSTSLHATYTVPANWLDKIAMAKKIIGRRLENQLSSQGYNVDESSGKALLDIVANPELFDICSDYLTLHLIYTDLANAMGREMYWTKAEFYHRVFKDHFDVASKAVNLDTTLDGAVDRYRANVFSTTRHKR